MFTLYHIAHFEPVNQLIASIVPSSLPNFMPCYLLVTGLTSKGRFFLGHPVYAIDIISWSVGVFSPLGVTRQKYEEENIVQLERKVGYKGATNQEIGNVVAWIYQSFCFIDLLCYVFGYLKCEYQIIIPVCDC